MKRSLKIFLAVLGLLVIVRIILPFVVLHYANKTLATMDGYYGHINDIDIALFRGAYKIDSIYLNKIDTTNQKQVPFFASPLVDLSIEWKALFHGSIVGELIFESPTLQFTKDKVEPKDVQQDSTDFKNLLDDFMPLQINRFEIKNADISYVDNSSNPNVDIHLTHLNVLALNLKNSYDSSILLPATITADATLYEGFLTFNMNLNPLATQPTFDLNTEIKNTNLVLLNDFFQAYAKIDVNKGNFGMYTEVAAKDGGFTGYVKPVIKDLDVLGEEDRNDNLLRKLWEGLAGAVGEIFENQPKDQFATKIPFEGSLDNPKANTWTTVLNILQNAFIRAIQPSIDNEINIQSVDNPKKEDKGFFKKLFSKDKEEEDK